jgi:hypothetical protein
MAGGEDEKVEEDGDDEDGDDEDGDDRDDGHEGGGRLTLDYNGPSVRRQKLRSTAVEICARSPLAVARS